MRVFLAILAFLGMLEVGSQSPERLLKLLERLGMLEAGLPSSKQSHQHLDLESLDLLALGLHQTQLLLLKRSRIRSLRTSQ